MYEAHKELEIIAELLQEWADKYGYGFVSGHVFNGHTMIQTSVEESKRITVRIGRGGRELWYEGKRIDESSL